MLKINIISLFPEMFAALNSSIPGRAQQKNLLSLSHINPRDFTQNPHQRVDDRPYGGGPGMVMQYQPLKASIDAAKAQLPKARVIYLSPQGQPLTQALVRELANEAELILLAGRYEGIDERLIETCVDMELSCGDYVLSGGELPAMVLIDALTRLLPGALGDEASSLNDSFSNELLDHPHYTRPETIEGLAVPNVLLNGDHKAISRWRLKQSLGKTWQKRPDLLKMRSLTGEEQQLLAEYIKEHPPGN